MLFSGRLGLVFVALLLVELIVGPERRELGDAESFPQRLGQRAKISVYERLPPRVLWSDSTAGRQYRLAWPVRAADPPPRPEEPQFRLFSAPPAAAYTYDAFNRRVEKVAGGVAEATVWSGRQPVEVWRDAEDRRPHPDQRAPHRLLAVVELPLSAALR